MSLHDDPHTPDGDVFVSPRHLASSTNTGDPALTMLIDHGWDVQHDDL